MNSIYNSFFLTNTATLSHFNLYLMLWKAQELNKQFAQKIRERDNIIIRVREANKQLKADSNNQNGFLNKTKPGVKKRLVSEQSSQSVSNGIHGLNYQQQMKGHAAPHYQRSYSYDTANSASTIPNHGKYSR